MASASIFLKGGCRRAGRAGRPAGAARRLALRCQLRAWSSPAVGLVSARAGACCGPPGVVVVLLASRCLRAPVLFFVCFVLQSGVTI
jgi:hypothetical protein